MGSRNPISGECQLRVNLILLVVGFVFLSVTVGACGGRGATAEVASARQKPFVHSGLFYDSEYVRNVRNNADMEPWRTALQQLRSSADDYLGIIPKPIRGRWNVPSPYDDSLDNEIAVRPIKESSQAMLVLAQYYMFGGGEKYASKSVQIANAWTGSLMELESIQAVYEAGWEMLVMAQAAEALREYPGWDARDREAFGHWLNERTWHALTRNVTHNNHVYWIAALAAATGVFTEDRGLFQWAISIYKDAITYGVAPDGHMPEETKRGRLGMFYQSYAIEPLALIAEIARRQGNDLWEFKYQGKDLKLAIDYLVRFFDRPEDWPWARSRQDLSFLDLRTNQKAGWFEIAYYRYRDPEIAEYLEKVRPVFDRRSGGMTTLTHGLAFDR